MYASVADIRAASTRLNVIRTADDGEIGLWMEEAYDVINSFCSQDFSLEFNTTKTLSVNHPQVFLPKPLSGTVVLSVNGETTAIDEDQYQFVSGSTMLRYRPLMYFYTDPLKNLDPVLLDITGTWGYAPSPLGLVIDAANELKAKYELHRASGAYHSTPDIVNAVTTIAPVDLTTAMALLNEIRTDMIAHFADVTVHLVADTSPPTSPAATDLATANALANNLIAAFNAHIASTTAHTTADTADGCTTDLNTPVLPRPIRRVFIKLVQRLALRAGQDDQYQMNSPYASETTGDGYSYSLSDGTMRNLLRPEDREMLWPYKNRGRMLM